MKKNNSLLFITSVAILMYAYYCHILMAFNLSFPLAIVGGFALASSFQVKEEKPKKETKTGIKYSDDPKRYYSSVYKKYFAYDKKQIEEFDEMTKRISYVDELSDLCAQFDVYIEK